MAIADGYWVAVPMPRITRETTRPPRVGSNGPSAPPIATRTSPTKKTRRAPNRSANRPAVGAATAVAR